MSKLCDKCKSELLKLTVQGECIYICQECDIAAACDYISPSKESPLPADNTFDFTIITKQLKLNADILMAQMSRHALNENEKLSLEIDVLKAKVVYLEQMLEAVINKVSS